VKKGKHKPCVLLIKGDCVPYHMERKKGRGGGEGKKVSEKEGERGVFTVFVKLEFALSQRRRKEKGVRAKKGKNGKSR